MADTEEEEEPEPTGAVGAASTVEDSRENAVMCDVEASCADTGGGT